MSYIDKFGLTKTSETIKFDMARSFQYLTTDIISHLCFGDPFGFVKSHGDVYGFIQTLESRLPIVEFFSVLTEATTLLSAVSSIPMIKRRLIPQPTDEDGLGKILGVRPAHFHIIIPQANFSRFPEALSTNALVLMQ